MMLLLILLQAADPPPIDFDLARLKPSNDRCAPGAVLSSEIVVCGRKRNRDVEGIDVLPDQGLLPKAELGLFGKVRAGVEADQANVGGFTSNRVKATVKIPF